MARPAWTISKVAALTAPLLLVFMAVATAGEAAGSSPIPSEDRIGVSDLYRVAIDDGAHDQQSDPKRRRPGRTRYWSGFRPVTPYWGGFRPVTPSPAVPAPELEETRCDPTDGAGHGRQLTELGAWTTSEVGRITLSFRQRSTAERDIDAIREVVGSTLLLVEEVLKAPSLEGLSVIVHENAASVAQLTGIANPHFDGRSVHVVCGWSVNLQALAHEITHAVSRLNYGLRAPALLGEGLAVWAAPRVLELAVERELPMWDITNGPDYYLLELTLHTPLPVQSLVDSVAFGEADALLAYGTASFVVSHLIEQRGLDEFWSFWSEGDGVQRAIGEHYGLTWAELDIAFRSALGLQLPV